MSSQRCEPSGLDRLELHLAHDTLLKLKEAIVHEEGSPTVPVPEGFEQQLDTMLSLLRSKLERPRV